MNEGNRKVTDSFSEGENRLKRNNREEEANN